MSVLVNESRHVRPLEVTFKWSPTASYPPFFVNGEEFPYPGEGPRYEVHAAHSRVLLTFTPELTIPSGVTVTKYKWAFGDGSKSNLKSPTKEYPVLASEEVVSLTILDSRGYLWTKRRPVHILPFQLEHYITLSPKVTAATTVSRKIARYRTLAPSASINARLSYEVIYEGGAHYNETWEEETAKWENDTEVWE